ncbi:MAG: hypothetical protein JOZ99_09005 [Actinobacteria bacterium]|nr:hypothetical protein [Actinomycetota bacterium]
MIGLAEVREFEAAAARLAAAFEPDSVPSPDVLPTWEAAVRAQRTINAVTTLLARRVEETRDWERGGCRDAAEFLAQRSGSSVAAARATDCLEAA